MLSKLKYKLQFVKAILKKSEIFFILALTTFNKYVFCVLIMLIGCGNHIENKTKPSKFYALTPRLSTAVLVLAFHAFNLNSSPLRIVRNGRENVFSGDSTPPGLFLTTKPL